MLATALECNFASLAGLGHVPCNLKKDLTRKTEQFSSATQLKALVAHVNQLVDGIKTGHLSAHNEALYRAELSRLREVLGLVDNRPLAEVLRG